MNKFSELLVEILLKILKNKKVIYFIVACVVVGAVWFFATSHYFENHWATPVWTYTSSDEEEVLNSDIRLRSAKIIMCPQIVVKYEDEVIFITNVLNLYDTNTANFAWDKGNDSPLPNVIFKISAGQKNKLRIFIEQLNAALKEKIGDDRFSRCQIGDVRIAKIEFQNNKANRNKEIYYFLSDSLSRRIRKKEVNLRTTYVTLDLDQINDVSYYADQCVRAVCD